MAARGWPRLGARAPSGTDLPFGDSDKTYQQSLSRRIGQGEVEKHFRDPPNAPHSGPTTAGTFSTAGFRAGAGLSRAAIARAPLPSRFGVDFFFPALGEQGPSPFPRWFRRGRQPEGSTPRPWQNTRWDPSTWVLRARPRACAGDTAWYQVTDSLSLAQLR